VFTRLASDPRSHAYVERRLNEGRSKPEIIRVRGRRLGWPDSVSL
jgi:hypothetical protein